MTQNEADLLVSAFEFYLAARLRTYRPPWPGLEPDPGEAGRLRGEVARTRAELILALTRLDGPGDERRAG